jgi:hypothetical protein
MTQLAALLVETSRFGEAQSLASDAKSIFSEAFGNDHWRTASASSAEGAALAGLKKYDEAEALLISGFNRLRSDAGATPYVVASANRWLVNFYEASGRPAEAAKYRAMPNASNRK